MAAGAGRGLAFDPTCLQVLVADGPDLDWRQLLPSFLEGSTVLQCGPGFVA
ncbi:MAG: hypothetical protein V5B44_14435 [Candidatus Accumulibacter necessarius]|jgi:hypothetical protein|uniref:hypothetical protein n=1 Tax=Candidatus Accumulibacter necessarius TaxID=2954386 RepID=UPI002FC28F83